MKNYRAVVSTTLLSVLFVAPSFAHHSITAVFDTSKTIQLKGTITKLEWRNPHASVYIDVKDSSGKIANWWVEMAGIANLAKAGLEQSMLDLNQTYSIEIFQAKDGMSHGVGITLIFPDSKTYDISEKPAIPAPAK